MAKYLDPTLVNYAFLAEMHLTIEQHVPPKLDYIDSTIDDDGNVTETPVYFPNVIGARLVFDLQDANRVSVGRKTVNVDFYRGGNVHDVPEIIQMVADNVDDAISQAKLEFAGYDGE